MDSQRINSIASNQRNNITQNQTNHQGSRNITGNPPSPAMTASDKLGSVRTPTNLKPGDVIRGEISDISNGEVTITLENNTMLRGQLDNSTSLSIGQTAAFRLSSFNAQGNVIMEPVGNYTETELTIINKALDEAGLPYSRYNQSAVKALMDNIMPINRDAIQNLMQQAYDLHTNDMNTLALMNKLMMKITPDSVRQFSNYRTGTEQLTGQLEDFSKNISDLLTTLSENGSPKAVADFGNAILNITLPELKGQAPQNISILSPSDLSQLTTLLSNTPMADETLEMLTNGTLSLREAIELLRDTTLDGNLNTDMNIDNIVEKLTLLEQSLEPSSGQQTAELKDSFKSVLTLNDTGKTEILTPDEPAAISGETAIHSSKSALDIAGRLIKSLQETASNSLNALKGNGNQTAEISGNAMIFDKLSDLYTTDSYMKDLTNSYMSADSRQELADKLQNMPISQNLINKLLSGEASTQDIMRAIKNSLPISGNDAIKDLFQSNSFNALFVKALQTSWSITPEQLKESGQPDKLYNQISSQMHQLENLINTALSGSDSGQMKQKAHDIQSNIALMKQLSESFSFMQLPLKLPNQNANGELYVYTQKEQRKINPEKTSVLLQLDMANLGNIEIKIDRNHDDISVKFALNDDDSVNLIDVNSPVLEENINDLGFTSSVKVELQTDTPASMDSFLNTKIKTNATENMKRFSFDIRA